MAETILNRRIVMASRPTGMPSLENFSMEEVEEPYDAPDGGVLLKTLFFSLDPYMRGRMDAGPSYAQALEPGGVMEGGSVCEVLASRDAAFKPGDIVLAGTGADKISGTGANPIVLGDNGAFAGMQAGATYVDHTTASASVARELYAAAKALGLHFIDAPVSGGQGGAQNGALTVMCGGDAAAFDAVQSVGMAFSKAFTLMGDSGAGQLTKMVNQICIAGLVQGLSEAIAFGQKAGLDMNLALDVIGKGAAQSWQLDNRGKTMVADKFEFGFAVDWMRKDLGLVLDEAKHNGARLPVTALVDQFYSDVQAMGGRRWDTSSLIKRLK